MAKKFIYKIIALVLLIISLITSIAIIKFNKTEVNDEINKKIQKNTIIQVVDEEVPLASSPIECGTPHLLYSSISSVSLTIFFYLIIFKKEEEENNLS